MILARCMSIQAADSFVRLFVRDAQGQLTLQAQPAYSPELNPEERIWTWMRRVVTHKHWFDNRVEPIQALQGFVCYLAALKAQVRQLCGVNTPESSLHHCRHRDALSNLPTASCPSFPPVHPPQHSMCY